MTNNPKLTKNDVVYVAKLAKLNLTTDEVIKFQKQLAKIVEYISQLSEVDTTDIEPTSQTTGLENVFRIDETKNDNSFSSNDALSGSDKTHNEYFVVDAVIDKDK